MIESNTPVEINAPGLWSHRRHGIVKAGPYWKVWLGNGDVFYATEDELRERPWARNRVTASVESGVSPS